MVWSRCLAVFGTALLLTGFLADHAVTIAASDSSERAPSHSNRGWQQLIDQATALGLPTRFLRLIEPGFITLEFEDLHTFAAEYHPEDHRMVLNRSLSFNAAGGVLRPLSALTHREVGTLYHELFHAFFDYLRTNPDRAALEPFASRVLHAAEGERLCRYQTVSIAPVIQRPTDTEPRYLSDRESWEALNETWAVFVGWTIWARLEVASQRKGKAGSDQFIRWIKRLAKADNDGDLVGYYEPEEASERAITRKRYLARTNRISPEEVRLLLETVLELSPDQAKQAEKNMRADSRPCQADGG